MKDSSKTIQASVKLIIDAPIDKVWNILTDTEKYSEWNPFVYHIETNKKEPSEGCEMTFSIRFEDGKETKSKEKVLKFTPPSELGGKTAFWEYRFAGFVHSIGMIRAVRSQTLTTMPDGKTEYSSVEIFRGWGKSFVPLKSVQKGFEIQGDALKKRCEDN